MWQARVDNVRTQIGDLENIWVDVVYYDDTTDATGANPIFNEALKFDRQGTLADFAAVIRARGAIARGTKTAQVTLSSRIGTVIPIP